MVAEPNLKSPAKSPQKAPSASGDGSANAVSSPGAAAVPPSPSSSSAAAPPSSTVRKRVTGKSSPSKPRPTSGGLSIGFTEQELAAQQAKRAAWMRSEVEERQALRKKVKETNAKNSDSALRVVLIFWLLVVLAIFYHVYQTIQRGVEQNAAANSDYDIPASETLLKAFRKERQ